MQLRNGSALFSASDLVTFLECEHATSLGLADLVTPLPRTADDDTAQLIQEKGYAHEASFFASLKSGDLRICEIPAKGDPESLADETLRAMREGYDYIFQGAFHHAPFFGRSDFLRRVQGPSLLGSWHYEVIDTKLSRSPKAKFLVQLCFYSDLLGEVQGRAPHSMHLVLGDQQEIAFRIDDYSRYFRTVRDRFLRFVGTESPTTYPERCERCPMCPWRGLCQERWEEDDHINRVAGITRGQVEKLIAAGVRSMRSLADHQCVPPGLSEETFERLRAQARLQWQSRKTGTHSWELLPRDPSGTKGLFRLPPSDPGDVFFDMEGDPFEDGGLEYLFGARFVEDGAAHFHAFWSHNRREEREAFEQFMDFVTSRLRRYPNAHIYHYAHYEPTALKRLMSWHGTRERELDDILRQGRLVDLYKVVRESMRTSAPGYSIKDLERFYMEAREGDVKDAGASIVHYERWRITGDDSELARIKDYNEDDCRSTHLLRDWLICLKSEHPGAGGPGPTRVEIATTKPVSTRMQEHERNLEHFRELLTRDLPTDRSTWTPSHSMRNLVYLLLDFHRRAAKPEWWALFARMDKTEDELIDDIECVGGLRLIGALPAGSGGERLYRFSFPEQETKLKNGKSVTRTDTAQNIGTIEDLDEVGRTISIRVRPRVEQVPSALSIGPTGPISTDILQKALFRFAASVAACDDRFQATKALLLKCAPRLAGRAEDEEIIRPGTEPISDAIDAVAALDRSYLFIQGPPGAGKTYAGSRIIVELLRRGYRIGVASNSHKAINNLLAAVVRHAQELKFAFRGVKKCTASDHESQFQGPMVENESTKDDVYGAGAQLLAGTAWLFADPDFESYVDYLFVDEAGQVSLANLVAMGTGARNLVLLGDQMQLGQPVQGVHPERSGESCLEYLLDDLSTIPPDRGIFLGTTWRMHEKVCRFISEAVYDRRLNPEPRNQVQQLLLAAGVDHNLKQVGIVFVPVEHEARAQRCPEEASVILRLYEDLLRCRFRQKDGREFPMTGENILVVAPYNSQVNYLRSVLPEAARVGTIDKFQGQEAEVVLISMTTSSGEYLPRNIAFLYDKNRLNVAISRAKCLSVVLANPALLRVHCRTPDEMELVNTLCWVKEYGST